MKTSEKNDSSGFSSWIGRKFISEPSPVRTGLVFLGLLLLSISLIALISTCNNDNNDMLEARPRPPDPSPDSSPSPVTGVMAADGTDGGVVNLSWTNPTNADFANVRITWRPTDGESQPVTLSGTRRAITGLTPGTAYTFTLIAVDNGGNDSSGVDVMITTVADPPPGPVLVGDSMCSSSADDDCIQIATFNIELFITTGSNAASPERIAAIGAIINDNGFDLIAMQEIHSNGINALLTAAGSGWEHTIGTSGGGQRLVYFYKSSLMTLTAMEIFGDDPDWMRLRHAYVATVTLTRSSKSFKIVNLHLKARDDASSCGERQRQIVDLDAWLDTQPGKIILTGDFNDRIPDNGICTSVDTLAPLEGRSDFQFLTTAANGFGDPFRITFISEPFRSVIDHFFVSNSLANDDLHAINGGTQKVEVVAHGDESISDHQPVYIWIKNF